MNDVALEINDNEFLRQFETTIDGQKSKIEYSSQERKIFLTKLIMSNEQIKKGYSEDFIIAVFNIIEERNIRVVPTSPVIASFMRKNKQKYKDLLPVGINI